MSKDKLIRCRVGQYEYEEIKKYADNKGYTISDVIREELLDKVYKFNDEDKKNNKK